MGFSSHIFTYMWTTYSKIVFVKNSCVDLKLMDVCSQVEQRNSVSQAVLWFCFLSDLCCAGFCSSFFFIILFYCLLFSLFYSSVLFALHVLALCYIFSFYGSSLIFLWEFFCLSCFFSLSWMHHFFCIDVFFSHSVFTCFFPLLEYF